MEQRFTEPRGQRRDPDDPGIEVLGDRLIVLPLSAALSAVLVVVRIGLTVASFVTRSNTGPSAS